MSNKFYEQLQPCDLFMYIKSGFIGNAIGLLTLSKYAHIACYIGKVRNKHTIIESHIETGVVEKEFSDKWIPIVDVFRYKEFLSQKDMIMIISSLRKYIGRKYDFGAFPATYLRSTIGLLLNQGWLRKGMPILNDRNTFFCSELQAVAWEESGHKLVKNVNPYNASPEDIPRDKMVYKILEGKRCV